LTTPDAAHPCRFNKRKAGHQETGDVLLGGRDEGEEEFSLKVADQLDVGEAVVGWLGIDGAEPFLGERFSTRILRAPIKAIGS
jgi:hypothetical protein